MQFVDVCLCTGAYLNYPPRRSSWGGNNVADQIPGSDRATHPCGGALVHSILSPSAPEANANTMRADATSVRAMSAASTATLTSVALVDDDEVYCEAIARDLVDRG